MSGRPLAGEGSRTARPGASGSLRSRRERGRWGGQRGLGRTDDVCGRVRGIDAHRTQLATADPYLPGDDHTWPSCLLGYSCHARDHLATQRLPVKAALPGQNEIGSPGPIERAYRVYDELRAWHPPAAKQLQGVADSACGAGTRLVRRPPVEKLGEVPQGRIEALDLLGGRTLLWAEDDAGAMGPVQDVLHVRRDHQLDAVEAMAGQLDVHAFELGQGAATTAKHIGRLRSKGGQQP